MKCLITGASSGIGRDMAKVFSDLGYEVIMVSSNKEKLENASECVSNSRVFVADFRKSKDVDLLCDFILKEKPDVVVNNAGFGAFGFFDEIDLDCELDMINVNVISVHKITRTCLEYMEGVDSPYILNVASSAGLMPGGPMLCAYYATKSYVRSYSIGIYKELRKKKSKISVSVLCPGPVNTNFNSVAGGTFSVKGLSSEFVSEYAVRKLFRGKLVIVPGFFMKLGVFFSRFIPVKVLLSILFKIQHKKR